MNLGRERSLADPRDVGLGDADDGADGRRSDAGAGGGAACGGGGGGDKWVGPVVDVQHGALRALEHDASAVSNDLVEEAAGVSDEGANQLCRSRVFVEHLGWVDGLAAKEG